MGSLIISDLTGISAILIADTGRVFEDPQPISAGGAPAVVRRQQPRPVDGRIGIQYLEFSDISQRVFPAPGRRREFSVGHAVPPGKLSGDGRTRPMVRVTAGCSL
jgi:hypothetical protein